MRRIIFTLLIAACVATPVLGSYGGLTYHEVQIKDELRRNVTTISSVTVRDSGTTDAATIYADPGRTLVITQPMTASSTNTTLDTSNATFFWYGAGQWDYTITDGTTPQTNNGSMTMTASDSLLIYPTYLTSINSTTLTDAQTQTYGTDGDWVANGGGTANRMTWTPATADVSDFWIGNSSFPADLNLYGSGGFHVLWDASEDTFEFLDNAILAIGTGDDWTVTHNGSTTTLAGAYSTSGVVTHSTDVVFDSTNAIKFDDNRSQLHFQDDSVLGIGGAADAVGDVTLTHDGSDLYMDAAIASEGWLIGDTTSGFDIDIRFETAGSIFTDYDGDFLTFTDDMDLRFGTGAGTKNGDFQISSSSANLLTIGQIVAGTGAVAVGVDDAGLDWTFYGDTLSQKAWWDASGDEWFYGADAEGVDVTFYGDTTGSFAKWDEDSGTNGAMLFDAADIALGDGDNILFGDALGTGDIKMYATGTDFIIDGVVAETGTVAIGVTDLGIDFKLWAATSAEGILFDASDEDLEFTGVNIVLDASSAIENAAVVVTDAATYQVLAASSGKTHIIGDLSQNTDIDLPPEAAGLYYRFIYAAAATEAHDHTIDTQAAGANFVGGVSFLDTDAGDAADEVHLGIYSNGSTNSKLVINNAATGTVVELYCDGSEWYTRGQILSDTIPSFADQ